MKAEKVKQEIIKELRPSRQKLSTLEKTAEETLRKLRKKGFNAEVGGSLAKKTLIASTNYDIDIFIILENKKDIQRFYEKIEDIDFKGEFRRVHGSRDYFQIIKDDICIELIPTIRTKDPEKAENVTDVSMMHVGYVLSHLKKKDYLREEIMLSKAFCRAQRCYGAESYINGFSGYALEVLTIHFNGFIPFLKNISKEKIIDPEKHFKNKKQALFEINASKLKSPIIAIDPTYKYRNILAGLGVETFNRFLESKKAFLKRPSKDFFQKKEIDIEKMKRDAKKNKARLIRIKIKSNREKDDIIATKCKRYLDFLSSELRRKQQEVINKEFIYLPEKKEANGYLGIKEKKEIRQKGPQTNMTDAVKRFRRVHEDAYKKGKHLFINKMVFIDEIIKKANKTKEESGAWAEDYDYII